MSIKALDKLPQTPLKINRALLSVYDKRHLADLGKKLSDAGVEIISTGGTYKALEKEGVAVRDVSDLTGLAECLDGRVKTLHPAVHAGILARTSYEPDRIEMDNLGYQPIELVVVNLYPFEETVADEDTNLAKAVEFIDIGGPTMVRAAAKNFAHVCILTNPDQYDEFLKEWSEKGTVSYETRLRLARQAFQHTARYDSMIARYFSSINQEMLPEQFSIALPRQHELRYGENPHQVAAVYGEQDRYIECFHGKELSYNNYLDIDGALSLMADFDDGNAVCSIFKHTIPCGVGTADSLEKAYRKAFQTDTASPFGGIVIVNRTLDMDTARAIDEIFTEIIIAPEYESGVIEMLKQKKNRRLIRLKESFIQRGHLQFRSIFGGALVQEADFGTTSQKEFQVVTKRKPTDKEMKDLEFAWKIVKHIKSNGIVYARDGQTLGIGSGQTSRVDSSEWAVIRARKFGLDLTNCVIASDAYFPFPDGVEAAAAAGATAVIQPGGSIRDQVVIDMADKKGMAMVFTGRRHFRH